MNCVDPEGLLPWSLIAGILGVKAAGLGIGLGGIYGTASIFDYVNGTNAAQAVASVAPKAAEISAGTTGALLGTIGSPAQQIGWNFIKAADKTPKVDPKGVI